MTNSFKYRGKALSRINHVSKGASFTVSVFRCLGFRDKVRDTECCDGQGVRERVKKGRSIA